MPLCDISATNTKS